MHNIFGNRFLDDREPAWHSLGIVLDEKEHVSASEGLKRIGAYNVELAELRVKGSRVDLKHRAIVRDATPDDPEVRIFGIVGPDYTLVTPQDACMIFDERVGVHVETIGALGHGERLFISTKLPTIDVHGDEVEMYLLFDNPMTGTHAAETRVTPVRAVCQNTLTLGRALATKSFRVKHDHLVGQRLGDWLQMTYDDATQKADVIREAFAALSAASVKPKDVKRIIERSYPTPNRPKVNAPDDVMKLRIKWWEDNVSLAHRRREAAQELFEGAGTALDTKAAKGTAWGVYNAVVETEDYRRGKDDAQIAESVLFGERAAAKERAFQASYAFATRAQ